MKAKKKVRIVVCSLFQDAGEATRALELANGREEQSPDGLNPEIIFLSHGGRFDRAFAEAGFPVEPAQPGLHCGQLPGHLHYRCIRAGFAD